MKMKKAIIKDSVYKDIKSILNEARGNAYKAVNFIMVEAYWQVGKRIVEEEQKGKKRAGYGEQLLGNLSIKLSQDFGKGFDPFNLWNMRKFYLSFPILDALRRELSWTHYRTLLRVESDQARNFYTQECAKAQWSTRQLERQIRSLCYERLLKNRKKTLSSKKLLSVHPNETFTEDHIKDPFVLEFLGLGERKEFKESQLEQAIINHLQKFLLELGRGFSFVGRQMRISTETQHFYIDLVFYNYILKCFVLIDLKVGKLVH